MSELITTTYLTANNRPNAPACTPTLVHEFWGRLVADAPDLEPLSHILLFSLAIGAHRMDFVPHIFEDATKDAANEQQLVDVYKQFLSAIMVIFPSIGGPWCTPPALCLAHMLEAKGVKDTSQLNIREPIGPRDEAVARDLLSNQYKKSADGNLKNMLGLYCRDFDTLLQTVALGYCHVGVTRTNVFKEHETELVLAAAIAACGATRSARVHGKSALNLGNSLKAVKAVYDSAVAINKWNNTEIVAVDVDELVADVAS